MILGVCELGGIVAPSHKTREGSFLCFSEKAYHATGCHTLYGTLLDLAVDMSGMDI